MEGRQVRRDVFQKGISMYTPEKETARPDHERAADEASEAGNLNGKDSKPASIIFAEADRVIESFPSFITRKGKHQAESRALRLFLAALAASRPGRMV